MADSFEATARQDTPPWYEEEGWLREPIFEDVPFEQSGWQPLIGVLERVNQMKALLLISVYEAQVRIAYQQYRRIRQEEESRFVAERAEAEQRNDLLRPQIRAVEQEMEQVRARWQPQLDALRQQLYPAWQDAYIKAAQVGINLRGDPLSEEAVSQEGQPVGDSSAAAPSAATPESVSLPNPPAPSHPPVLTPAEVMHEHNLPTYPAPLIPSPLWVALIIMAGMGLGWIIGLVAGLVAPGQLGRDPLWLGVAMLAGVASTYLWVRTLWGATAIVAELYHLFGWHERKARRATWSIGVALLVWLLATLASALLLGGLGRTAATVDERTAAILIITALLFLPLLACALLAGFLEGRAKPIGHWIASQITRQERARSQSADTSQTESHDTWAGSTPESVPQQEPGATLEAAEAHRPTPEQEAWVAIRRYQALYRQYHHLKGEMEQELLPYRQQIEQLQAEMRPVYPAMPPHSRNRIRLAYLEWLRMYRVFLQYLADALRECQGGEELAEIVHRRMLQILAEERR